MNFEKRRQALQQAYDALIERPNKQVTPGNGIYSRYEHPVLTAMHTPLTWRYDLREEHNPHLMERFGINGVFNAGAIMLNGKYLLVQKGKKNYFLLKAV